MMTLLRIAINLWFMLWRIIAWPLQLIGQRIFGLAVIVMVIWIVIVFTSDDDNLDTTEITDKQGRTVRVPLVQPVSRYEQGNSAFATDLIAQMKKDELIQYSRTFYWTMDNIADGKDYDWSYYNVHGKLKPADTFTNKRGEECRNFNETLKVHEVQQQIRGTACERPGGGWCKLRPNSTPACDLGRQSGVLTSLGDFGRKLGGFFR